MSSKAKTILGIAILAAFMAVASVAYNLLKAKSGTPEMLAETGKSQADKSKTAAPDFTVVTADGSSVKLSDMKGKPVVLNFWASWCPPCKSEMPEFDKVNAELNGDVTFMMIDLVDGSRETVETGAAYVAEQGYSFPIYYDTSGKAASTYGISAIPTTIFIDSEGNIVTGAQGAINEETLRKGIGMILGEGGE